MCNRILVVDDEEVVLGAVKKALKKTGYEIDTATSAAEALTLLTNSSYDVVITDLMMPEIDGLQLMQQIRDRGVNSQIIMITGYPTVKSALKALRLGAFVYVTKPFTRQELVSAVVRAVRRGSPAEDSDLSEEFKGKRPYFIPGHTWVMMEEDGRAKVGLTRDLACTLGEIVQIDFPAVKDQLEQGRKCAVVRATDGVEHHLNSPISGKVIEINERANADPWLAVNDPYISGWLMRIEPKDWDREIENLSPVSS